MVVGTPLLGLLVAVPPVVVAVVGAVVAGVLFLPSGGGGSVTLAVIGGLAFSLLLIPVLGTLTCALAVFVATGLVGALWLGRAGRVAAWAAVLAAEAELAWKPEPCVGCGACVEACPHGARGAPGLPDRDRCRRCFARRMRMSS